MVEPSASLHVALCGPATIGMLEPLLGEKVPSNGYPYPGLPTLAEQLIVAGHRVTIVSTANDIDAPLQFAGNHLKLILIPSQPRARDRAFSFFRPERRGIAAALQQVHPDIIHAHWTYEFALAAAEAGVAPVLVTARDSPLAIFAMARDPYRFFRLLLAIRARFSIHHLTVPSPYLVSSLRWFGHFGPIPVIPNFIPALPAPGAVVHDMNATVLCVGDAGRRKNVSALLRAMALVRSRHPDARLRLVGQGLGPGGPVEAWARQQDLDNGVEFVGYVDRQGLAREYARSTVYCSPSLEESFGNTLLEALQAGLPVIAGKSSGAVPWVLFDGQAGRLVNVRDPAAIAVAICDAIDSPSSTVAPGFDVAASIADRYSQHVVAAQYLAEYRRVIALEREQQR
jgi:glycosyltransferase involved in cell wall biosynthesis